MPSDQGTNDHMLLGYLMTSQDKPKIGVLCTVSPSVVQGWTRLSKTVHKTPTLGLSCELIEKLSIIWSLVPWPGVTYLQLLSVVNLNLKHFILRNKSL